MPAVPQLGRQGGDLDLVLGTTEARTGSYVDRGRVARSCQEPYDPQREKELCDAAERFIAAFVG
ncbi:hypothetical protein [Streptomyces scopuliridis]|uniref:hypothetical protein n=1 Tax=Streptomyces scopuliridis TaxID=452529 RepID=UPI003413D9F9